MGLLAEGQFTTYLFIGAAVITVAVLLLRTQRNLARPRNKPISYEPGERSQPEPRAHHLGAPSAMVDWEVQMHDVARELSGQLDSKMGLLEHLIREADRAASRLEKALAATQDGQRSSSPDESTPSIAQDPLPASPADADPVNPPGPVNQASGLRAADTAERSPQSEASMPDQDAAPRPTTRQRRREEICTLADYGYDAAEIARRTGVPIGEVQLILGLRERGPR